MIKPEPYQLHWFRRDLRVASHPGLKSGAPRVLGVFFFDSTFLGRADFSHRRFAFFLKTLRSLQDELRELGGDLLVLEDGPDSGFEKLFETFRERRIPFPSKVTFCRDYEPFARARDKRITNWLQTQAGVDVETFRDHLLIEPHELFKPGGRSDETTGTYQVFSPFAKRWFELFKTPEIQARVKAAQSGNRYLAARARGKEIKPSFSMTWLDLLGSKLLKERFSDQLDRFETKNRTDIAIPEAGSLKAFQALIDFGPGLNQYAKDRDFPDLPATSRLSIFFKNGSITGAQVIAHLDLGSQLGASTFFKELVWREFYYHVLFHHPRVESEAFLQKYKNLEWENRPEHLEAWKEGRTGFPIVDAGMRELRETGWMHNRVRMIVASFLTKDLLVDWRLGEKFFMNQLLDGDLAPNNGGWQWAASTGCDPQPYFRIFNPELQSKKFDPEARYIQRFLPELRSLKPAAIHALHRAGGVKTGVRGYPAPIVDHQGQKLKTLALYSAKGS